MLDRRKAAAARHGRDSKAATAIEKIARGMIGRKRWEKLNFNEKVIRIQRLYRGNQGRKKGLERRRRTMSMLMNIRFRMNIFHKYVAKRSAASAVILLLTDL